MTTANAAMNRILVNAGNAPPDWFRLTAISIASRLPGAQSTIAIR
jgi:hypothetical protein